MNLKKSPFATQDERTRDLDYANDFPTIADLMRNQKESNDKAKRSKNGKTKISKDHIEKHKRIDTKREKKEKKKEKISKTR